MARTAGMGAGLPGLSCFDWGEAAEAQTGCAALYPKQAFKKVRIGIMKQPDHISTAQTHVSSGVESSIDALRIVGPAHDRLRRRLGTGQLDALEGTVQGPWASLGVGIASDKGLRLRNEDSAVVLVGRKSTPRETVPVVLAAIADGMGGHAHGDRASGIAIETLTEHVANNFILADSQPAPDMFSPDIMDELLTEGVRQAHAAVRQGAADGGCTLTCLLAVGDTLHIAHVGDSRAYLIRAGNVAVLTRDHLVVRQLEEIGVLTSEEAARHPQRHILYRALGMDDEFEVDVIHRQIQSTSRLLLCTDGVWGPLSASDIYLCVALGQTPQDICERLIRDAMLRQATDNATAVLLHLPAQGAVPATQASGPE